MTEHVRVKLENGAEATLPRAFAEAKGIKILDKSAVDARGEALNDKPHVELVPAGTYAEHNVPKLREEIARRNEGRGDDQRIPTTGNKDDLVAALEADDDANRGV